MKQRRHLEEMRERFKGRQWTLSGKILWIVYILVAVGLLSVAAGCAMLGQYHSQVSDMENQIMDTYISKNNQAFGSINTFLRGMLSGDEDQQIQRVTTALRKITDGRHSEDGGNGENIEDNAGSEAGENSKDNAGSDQSEITPADVVAQNKAIIDLKNSFLSMGTNSGGSYNFFYYNSDSKVMVERGSSEYYIRCPFIKMISKKIEADALQYTKNGKWFVCGDYLCTVFKSSDGILGAWIRAEDFARDIIKLSPIQCASFEIYDPDSGTVLIYERDENGTITFERSDQVQDTAYYSMQNALFGYQFSTDTSEFDTTLLRPMLFLSMIVIYMIVVCIVLIYTKQNILEQVHTFYDNLLAFKDTAGFNEKSGLVEFSEAGKVLNQLSEELNKTRIAVYEEQLSRQKTELDYLQLQIRPHFYVNCLNVIYSMAQVGCTDEIQEISVLVSDYMRYIFKKSTELVPVKTELDFVKNYLKILECMNSEAYECRVVMDEDLADFNIPPVLIQTFVENSIKHNQNISSGFAVEIIVQKQKDAVNDQESCRITISDNGQGFSEESLEHFNTCAGSDTACSHIGVKNALTRLNMFYGNDASIEFHNRPEGGARIDILLPVMFT